MLHCIRCKVMCKPLFFINSCQLSCDLPLHIWGPIHVQGFHLQLIGVLLFPLGWLLCLASCSAWHHGNKGLQYHWNLSRWSWVDGPSPSLTGQCLTVFFHRISGLSPSALSVLCPCQVSAEHTRPTSNPLLVNLPKSRITSHFHSFILHSSCLLNHLPHSLQSHSSLQVFKTVVHHNPKLTSIPSHDLFYTL